MAACAAVAAHQPLPHYYLTVLADRPGLRETYEQARYRFDDAENPLACSYDLVDFDLFVL